MYRIVGEHIYKKLIEEEDKQAIIDATSDWRADGAMNLESFEYVFPWWLEHNQSIKDYLSKQTEAPGTDWWFEEPCWGKMLTEGIYLKSNDKCIGFERLRIIEGSYVSIVAALIPAERGKGYYIEHSAIGLKSIFETRGCLSLISKTPTSMVSSKQPYKDITPISVDTKLDRVEPVEYRETVLTREWYTQWINKPEQSTIKNVPYTFHWRYTG
jgi:hypothetical protein